MQHIEYRHKISRHKPLFHGTFCILKKGIHFLMISFSLGLAFLSLSLSFSGELQFHLFSIAHDFDRKACWQPRGGRQ